MNIISGSGALELIAAALSELAVAAADKPTAATATPKTPHKELYQRQRPAKPWTVPIRLNYARLLASRAVGWRANNRKSMRAWRGFKWTVLADELVIFSSSSAQFGSVLRLSSQCWFLLLLL